jgi:mono/diheme cytochrome c family protein
MKFAGLALAAFAFAAGLSYVQGRAPAYAASGDVVFSAAQVAQGAKVFAANCASCHGANLEGVSAPALGGKQSGLAQQSIGEAYAYISEQMPMTAPASLSSAQYLDVLAYLLDKHGRKPGTRPLTASVAKTSGAKVDLHG